MKRRPQLSFWQIWNMCFGFLDIQFGFALQNANGLKGLKPAKAKPTEPQAPAGAGPNAPGKTRLDVASLTNEQLATLAKAVGFPEERVARLDLEVRRNTIVPMLQELDDKRLLDSSVLGKPVGYLDQPAFVNACALVETTLGPRELLEALLAVERRHGRVRDVPNGPRTLDLDIVLYGDLVLHEHGLTLPHPRAHERAFVLAPLLEVWPDAIIPGRGAAASFRERVRDQAIERLPEAS